jgi:signal transduction histidine kinase
MHALESSERNNFALGVCSEASDVVLVVEDKGIGVREDQVGRVFEPFFTTKPDGEGTGLGLSIVKTIVERHRGSIDLWSEEGVGTRFTIRFPTEEG